MSKLIYGRVTGRNQSPWTKNIRYTINGNVHVVTPTGSMCDRALHEAKTGFVMINDNNYVEDFYAWGCQDTETFQKQRAQSLKVTAQRMVDSYKALNRNDMQVVAGAVGLTLGTFTAVTGAVTFFTSIFTGDFTGTLGGAAAAVVGGAIGYVSYENMTEAMQNAYNCSQQFKACLENYHNICIKYAPDHMKDLPMYEPEFKAISKILREVFPQWGEQDLMYNRPNWEVA